MIATAKLYGASYYLIKISGLISIMKYNLSGFVMLNSAPADSRNFVLISILYFLIGVCMILRESFSNT